MLQCPRCGSTVPDGRTSCQICMAEIDPATAKAQGPTGLQAPDVKPAPEDQAPIVAGIPGVDRAQPAQQPQPQAPMPGMAPATEVRRTLAGDIIEVPAAPPPRPATPAAQQQPVMRPIPAVGAPRTPVGGPGRVAPRPQAGTPSPRPGAPVTVASRSSSGSAGAVVAIIVVLLLAVAGGGGWWWWTTREQPKQAATQFLTAVQKGDWKVVYNDVEFSADQKKKMPEDTFVKVMGFIGRMATLKEFKVNSVAVADGKTTVSITTTTSGTLVPGGSQTKTSDLPMIKVGGAWKVDSTGAGNAMGGVGGKVGKKLGLQ